MMTRPATITEWDGDTFTLLSNEQISNLPADDRRRYISRLHDHMLDNGRDASPWYHEWKKFDSRCRHEDCASERYEDHQFCVRHLDIDTIDPNGAVNRRATKAKLRMAEMLERSVDELEKIISASPEDMAPAVRLKAIDTLLDRAHVPRQTAQSVEMSGQIEHTHVDITGVISARLDRLADSMISGELEGIESASAAPADVISEPED